MDPLVLRGSHTIIVMGVSGSGKTTVGMALAKELGWSFVDADSLHSPKNKTRMAAGFPLTDADREPWLVRITDVLTAPDRGNLVLACSALKRRYREVFRRADSSAVFVYLRGTTDVLTTRLQTRRGHFVTSKLLASQIATLEEPNQALVVDVELDISTIVSTIREQLCV